MRSGGLQLAPHVSCRPAGWQQGHATAAQSRINQAGWLAAGALQPLQRPAGSSLSHQVVGAVLKPDCSVPCRHGQAGGVLGGGIPALL